MKHSLILMASVVSAWLASGACTSQVTSNNYGNVEETSIAATTATSTATVTPLNTTPFPTYTPSSTYTLPPSPTVAPALVNDLFFGGVSPDCELPCWHGLKIGESGYDDVQRAFDKVFDFRGVAYPSPDFIAEPPPGYEVRGHYWNLSDIGRFVNFFMVVASFKEDTGRLEELDFVFETLSTEFNPDIRPQRIIRELGMPSQWLVSLERAGQGEGASLSSLMVYDNGVSFFHTGYLLTESTNTENGAQATTAQFCLGEYFPGTATIGEPLINGFNNLSPLQELTYQIRRELVPIQEVFKTSLEDFTQRALQEENPCFYAPISDG